MSMGPCCNVVSISHLRRVSGYLRCSARLAEKELILPSTQPHLSLPARLVKGTSLSGRRATLTDHEGVRRVAQGAGSTPAGPSLPTLNRRQFFTLILIAPLLRVYRARHKITISLLDLFAATLKHYTPALHRNMCQTNQAYKLLKERLS
jgi:hypothetical protein